MWYRLGMRNNDEADNEVIFVQAVRDAESDI